MNSTPVFICKPIPVERRPARDEMCRLQFDNARSEEETRVSLYGPAGIVLDAHPELGPGLMKVLQ